ncbi:glycosyltransferase family 4 protein [Stutzerimonas azotifigens]|uniref:glycosyltransferase family 4 protein n=1 Tax=Stutzerimonas azotifigens TaxID=291995 RepID=UPI00040046E6|nr:glycosyltransferase family 1 protein [Stutzerimonas azotifigens]
MIVVNARFLTQQTRGVQRFAEQISLQLAAQRTDLVFVAPHDVLSESSAQRLDVRRIGRHTGHLWEQLDLPLWLARHGNPLLVSLCNTGPLAYRNQIAAHHDITYVRHPESYTRRFRWAYRLLLPLLLGQARALITVSEFSRREIAGFYGYPPGRMLVVANAVGEPFRPSPPGGDRPACRPYLLAVSSPSAHKNFARLIEAFRGLQGHDEVELRIVGDSHPSFADPARPLESDTRIRLLGRLSDEQLIEQYRGATAFVFPSLYEGFGIPPLEAQACGCPVIASRAAAIPEVLGDSAGYFDPASVADIRRAMHRVLADAAWRETLVLRGQANLTRYSWQASAARVSRLIDRFCRRPGYVGPTEFSLERQEP